MFQHFVLYKDARGTKLEKSKEAQEEEQMEEKLIMGKVVNY